MRRANVSTIAEALRDMFRDDSLETSIQRFQVHGGPCVHGSLQVADMLLRGSGAVVGNPCRLGANVVARVKAARGDGTENILIIIDLSVRKGSRKGARPHEGDIMGVTRTASVVSALAALIAQEDDWAKDVVIVGVDGEAGLKAFLTARYSLEGVDGGFRYPMYARYSDNDDIELHGEGSCSRIQGALNAGNINQIFDLAFDEVPDFCRSETSISVAVQITNSTFGRWRIEVEGVNGRLPNLDLVNVLVSRMKVGEVAVSH